MFLIVSLTPLNNYFHPKIYGQTFQKDSLVLGEYYKVIGKNETSCEGYLVKYDSIGLVIRLQNQKELNIEWEMVQQILDKNDNVSYFAKEIYKIQIQNEEKISHTVVRDTSDECDVYMSISFLLKEVKIIEVRDSTFKILKSEHTKDFNIVDLKKIKITRHGFWTGAAIGGISSFAAIALLGATTGAHSGADWNMVFVYGLLVAAPAGLLGGFIGEFASQDSDYSFNNLNLEIKRERLKLFVRGLLK